MITFTCCLIALIVGYFTYGKFVERVFGVDPPGLLPLSQNKMVLIIYPCLLGRFS